MAPDPEIGVTLMTVDSTAAPGTLDSVVAEIPLVYIDEVGSLPPARARLLVTRDLRPVRALIRSVDRWFLLALAVTVLGAIAIAWWLAARISKPLVALAEQTRRLDLDRLDQVFATGRDDEVGMLARLLDAMTGRLRSSVVRLREAERRAATGDMARQINHDIKNGLAPIRHVMRHLAQVAESEPDRLPAIFAERRDTLQASLEYLETLARNYARLTPPPATPPINPNVVMREVAQALARDGAAMELKLADAIPMVRADPVALRRVVENLVANALDALEGGEGWVALGSEVVPDEFGLRVRLTIRDSGRGMTRDELEHVFDDFYTTKSTGTGLGLSVVRGLVSDLGGTLRVETAPGKGSTFVVELPMESTITGRP